MSKTYGETYGKSQEPALSENEQKAVELLAQDGWTHAELTMCFECSNGTLSRILQ